MENKIITMRKIMIGLLQLSIVFYFATRWIESPVGVISIIVIAVSTIWNLILKKRKPVDEREIYLSLASGYGAFISTLAFIFVMEAIEYIKLGKVSPQYVSVLLVLMISQGVFWVIFKEKKIKEQAPAKE